MDASESTKIILGWANYSTLTKVVTVGVWILVALAFIAQFWSSYLRGRDDEKAAEKIRDGYESRLQTQLEAINGKLDAALKLHDAVHVGDKIGPDTQLPDGWSKKVTVGGRTTVEATTTDSLDLAHVEMKSVGVLADDGSIDVLFRFISILDGGIWEPHTCRLMRDGVTGDANILDMLRRAKFAERLNFANDVIAVGTASRQADVVEPALKLSEQRADALAKAITDANVLHHPQALYVLPLGGSKTVLPLGAPSEANHRSALVIGVKKKSTDIALSTIIDDVIIRASLRNVSLGDFTESQNAKTRLGIYLPGQQEKCDNPHAQ